MFLLPQIPDLQILSNHNKPYINGKLIYSLVTGLVVQAHILSSHAVINAAFWLNHFCFCCMRWVMKESAFVIYSFFIYCKTFALSKCAWICNSDAFLSRITHTHFSTFTFTFSRRFYPKRLTIAFRLYIFISTCVPWESNPQPFAQLTQCSTTEPHRNTAVRRQKAAYYVYTLREIGVRG